jgi:hypothetical protein
MCLLYPPEVMATTAAHTSRHRLPNLQEQHLQTQELAQTHA